MFEIVEDGRHSGRGWIIALARFDDEQAAKRYVRLSWRERRRQGGRLWFLRAPSWVLDEQGHEHQPPPPSLMRLWREPAGGPEDG